MSTGTEIASAVLACTEAFEACLQSKELMKKEWAEKRLGDFRLWISGTGARARGRASLDSRLALKPQARGVITNVLSLLSILVEDCNTLASSDHVSKENENGHDEVQRGRGDTLQPEEPHPRAFSPWSDESGSNDEDSVLRSDNNPLENKKEKVETFLRQLSQIAMAIRRSGRRSRLQKADKLFQVDEHRDLEQHLSNWLRIRLGSVNSETPPPNFTEVQKRLISCNLRRRNRFIHAQKQSKALQPVRTQHFASSQNETKTEERREKAVNSTTSSNRRAPRQEVGIPNASAGENTVSASGMSDSFVLNTNATHSQAASSVASITATKVEYPLPPEDTGALSFMCPCCCQPLDENMATDGRWRKHLAEDLSPYTCVLPHCPKADVLYPKKEAWRQHLSEDHQNLVYWVCLVCKDGVRYESEDSFTRHISQLHADSVPTDKVPLLLGIWKRSIPLELESCPICDWPTSEEGEIDKEALLDHIAVAVHSFSLRALPWADDNGEETPERVEHSTNKVSQWLTRYEVSNHENKEKGLLPVKLYHSEHFLHHPYFKIKAVASDAALIPNSAETSSTSRNGQLDEWRENDSSLSFESEPAQDNTDLKEIKEQITRLGIVSSRAIQIRELFVGLADTEMKTRADGLVDLVISIVQKLSVYVESAEHNNILRFDRTVVQRVSSSISALDTLLEKILDILSKKRLAYEEGTMKRMLQSVKNTFSKQDIEEDLARVDAHIKLLWDYTVRLTTDAAVRSTLETVPRSTGEDVPESEVSSPENPDKMGERFDANDFANRAVLRLQDTEIGQIMTQMEHVFTMSEDTILDENATVDARTHLRIPIHQDSNPENFIGLLLVEVLASYDPRDRRRVKDFDLQHLPEAPPETSCSNILDFFSEPAPYTVLVSMTPGESEGARGVVTLEDVIELIIGTGISEAEYYEFSRRLHPDRAGRLLKSLYSAKRIRMRDGRVYNPRTDEFGSEDESDLEDNFDFADVAEMPRAHVRHTPASSIASSVAPSIASFVAPSSEAPSTDQDKPEFREVDPSEYYARAELTVKNSELTNGLIICSLNGDLVGLRSHAESGADVNATNKVYGTALEVASAHGREGIVKYLLKHGANVDTTHGIWNSPVFAATYFRRGQVLKELLEAGAQANTIAWYKGPHSKPDCKECFESLEGDDLCLSCSMQAFEPLGGRQRFTIPRVPLLYASWKGWVDIMTILLDFGADVHGWLQAWSNGDDTQGKRADRRTALHVAAEHNHVEAMRLLIDRGADVNAVNIDGETALHNAPKHGQDLEVARLLCDRGADVNATDHRGDSPLHIAIRRNRVDISELLINCGANANAINEKGDSPLHDATRFDSLEIIGLLSDAGTDVNTANSDGDSALHCASRMDQVDAIRLLLYCGANVNAVNNAGDSPLHCAASYGQVEVTRLLLEKGANVDALNHFGSSALDVVSGSDRDDLVRLLLERDAPFIEGASADNPGEVDW